MYIKQNQGLKSKWNFGVWSNKVPRIQILQRVCWPSIGILGLMPAGTGSIPSSSLAPSAMAPMVSRSMSVRFKPANCLHLSEGGALFLGLALLKYSGFTPFLFQSGLVTRTEEQRHG